MYKNVKSKVVNGDVSTCSFICKSGVRQGENLSPFLFSLFLNDLEHFLSANDAKGLKSLSEKLENDVHIYLKLFILLYADDTSLLSESSLNLQHQLDTFLRIL